MRGTSYTVLDFAYASLQIVQREIADLVFETVKIHLEGMKKKQVRIPAVRMEFQYWNQITKSLKTVEVLAPFITCQMACVFGGFPRKSLVSRWIFSQIYSVPSKVE